MGTVEGRSGDVAEVSMADKSILECGSDSGDFITAFELKP